MIDIEKCRITHYPAMVLAKPAEDVERIDESIKKLVEKMTDIMLEHKGIGLAGPQVGVPLRIFIISLDGTREKVRVYINPTVKPVGKTTTSEEGCLSVPGIYTNIRRYKECTVTAADLDGNEFTEEAEGVYARCLQHEYDHINGITIADKMSAVSKIAHRKKLQELRQQQQEIDNVEL
jgi:peptide deformylase